MNEQYSRVCNKIIENYSNILFKSEIEAIKKIIKINNYENQEVKLFINKLIDRIWTMTLTNPKKFINGQPFIFLVSRDIIPIEYNPSDLENLKKQKKHFLEIITDDSIINSSAGINGIIVEIDYLNTLSEPLLPCDFIDKKYILANTKLDIKGIYNISLNLGNYDAEEELSSDYAIIGNFNKVNINKALYNFIKTNKVLTKNDKDMLANILIVYYLLENNLDKNYKLVELRDILKEQYKTSIFQEYTKYFNNTITLDELINNVFKMLENEPILQMFDKNV